MCRDGACQAVVTVPMIIIESLYMIMTVPIVL